MAVEAITVADASGAEMAIPAERIDADGLSDPPRIAVSDPPIPGRPRNGISITVRAGYGALSEDVPATLRLAVKIIVAHWFENRGDVIPGLDPGIHVFGCATEKTWMAGTRPAMTHGFD
jgi:uncharacterized phiE125 gp8 family phage protein